ncbi:hypothetical protein R1T16_12875 [Flavobacterium sp. DG1-102-2]|uniref:hypothetical protein n=1 Tax=Flavobacterium sp. DG1-102-2 TaxID=3081663 RepID=UPI00294A8B36|nr:hypothetical protein [Flavobacterium sp. DG1-102-2]MDV6169322.1 hypothetical protein [Flavobacterium sp. DG1-102-2]
MKSQFTVPEPCHESWNAMTPDEQGRFCSLCSKSVTDFTQMSNDEITIYLKMNNGSSVCGRFRSSQLQKESISIPKKVLYSQTKFVNVFLLALLVTMGSMLFSCKNTTKGEVEKKASIDTVATQSAGEAEYTTGITIYELPDPIEDETIKIDTINPAIKFTNN